MGPTHRHARYANWTLKTREGKYLSVNDENELTISDKPTVFRVIFIDNNRQFVKLYVHGKGYVKVSQIGVFDIALSSTSSSSSRILLYITYLCCLNIMTTSSSFASSSSLSGFHYYHHHHHLHQPLSSISSSFCSLSLSSSSLDVVMIIFIIMIFFIIFVTITIIVGTSIIISILIIINIIVISSTASLSPSSSSSPSSSLYFSSYRDFVIAMPKSGVISYCQPEAFFFSSKVKPDSTGCLEAAEDERYPKLFKVTHIKGPRFIRLGTVVFIHPNKALNPSEWTQTTAALSTDQVLLLKNMIEGMKPDAEFKESWRYLTDLPSTDVDDKHMFHPRHLKLVFITPVQGKLCLRPNRSHESVFTVERQRTHVNVSLSAFLAIYQRNDENHI